MTFGAFKLNSISAAASVVANSITATGGTINYTYVSGSTYKVHTFTTAGTNNFVISSITGTPTVDAFLVGGGGGSGGSSTNGTASSSGGGGGGQVLTQSAISVSAQTYSLTVGAGGSGGTTSGTRGTTGTSTTGFGYTSVGGGGGGGTASGQTPSAGGAAGGGGGASNTNTTGATGTLGGGNGLSGGAASGGGGSNISAGTSGSGSSAASGIGGNGGSGVASTFATGSTLYYASGGPGNAAGGGQVTNAGLYGNGAQGGNNSSVPFAGSTGSTGVAIVRYPLTTPFTLSYVTNATSTTSSITIPATAQTGDVAILIDTAWNNSTTAPSAVTPTGFSSLSSSVSQTILPACRGRVWYKILAGGDAGSSITGMNGNLNSKMVIIYRPSIAINTASRGTIGTSQATDAAPTNQTLSFASNGFWSVGIAVYATTPGFSISTRGSTTAATRELNNGTSLYVKTFEALDPATTFSNSTISMSDSGTNILISDNLKFN